MRDEIRKALFQQRRAILCAPPGTGKTRMAKWIMGSYANRPKSEGQSGFSLFVVHRRGLVDNASNSFSESPELPHSVIMSGRDTDFDHSVHVASNAAVPSLKSKITKILKASPKLPWDAAVRRIASECFEADDE